MRLLTYYSSYLFLLPVLFYFFNNKIPVIIPTILFINFILSILFWSNPIHNSFIHRLDAIFAKISISTNIVYIYINLSTLNSYFFLYFVLVMLYFFYLSHKNSLINWLGDIHIACHFIAHICSLICLGFMFLI